jgi:hypothetical protein
MDNSINVSEGIAFPVSPDPNFIITEKTVVLPTSTAEKDKMAAPITNIE